MVRVEFGSRQEANNIRDRPAVRRHLAPSDDRRRTTVVLSGSVPESILSRVQSSAAESRKREAMKSGQSALTRREREQIDFSKPGVNVPKVRSIKAIAEAEGVEDFKSFADLSLSVDENREVLASAATEEQGRRDLGRSREQERTRRLARGRAAQRRGVQSAVEPAIVDRDPQAQDAIRDEQAFGTDVFDIAFQPDPDGRGVEPTGRTAELLEDRHESRSERSQQQDERLRAPKTRDPIEWANNPDQLDFPGIDTVDTERELLEGDRT